MASKVTCACLAKPVAAECSGACYQRHEMAQSPQGQNVDIVDKSEYAGLPAHTSGCLQSCHRSGVTLKRSCMLHLLSCPAPKNDGNDRDDAFLLSPSGLLAILLIEYSNLWTSESFSVHGVAAACSNAIVLSNGSSCNTTQLRTHRPIWHMPAMRRMNLSRLSSGTCIAALTGNRISSVQFPKHQPEAHKEDL